MVEWFTLAEESLKAGNLVLDEDRRNKLVSFFRYLFTENKKILLFGPSGSGKSQFIESLNNSVNETLRTHTSRSIKIPITNLPLKFIDTPGHEYYAPDRKREIEAFIKNGVEGIINIVSYGYVESEETNSNDVFDHLGNVKGDFLVKNRVNEINQLNEWLPWVTVNQNVKWIINLINKADVWWDDSKTIRDYYQSGEYGDKFVYHKQFMRIKNLPYSSIIKPYYNSVGCPKFGERTKAGLKNHFLKEFLALLG
ncbi:hypothetical protein VF12_40270 [Nostoc linckia z15]|nr:hypothetical protein VF12_40270 [Nostoc linckia z15]